MQFLKRIFFFYKTETSNSCLPWCRGFRWLLQLSTSYNVNLQRWYKTKCQYCICNKCQPSGLTFWESASYEWPISWSNNPGPLPSQFLYSIYKACNIKGPKNGAENQHYKEILIHTAHKETVMPWLLLLNLIQLWYICD